MTSFGFHALGALENMLEASAVPAGWQNQQMHSKENSRRTVASPPRDKSTDSRQSSREVWDVEGKLCQEVRRCFRDERRFLNQWFVMLLRELQNLHNQTGQGLSHLTPGSTADQEKVESVIPEEVEHMEWSRMSHQLDAIESSVSHHQANLDAIHSQLSTMEQALKDSANLAVHQPFTAGENNTFIQSVVSTQQQILQEIQTISAKYKPGKSPAPPVSDVAMTRTNTNLSRKQTINQALGRAEVDKDILAFEALRGWVRPGTEPEKALEEGGSTSARHTSGLQKKRVAIKRARSIHVLSRIEVASNILVILNTIYVGFQADMSLRSMKGGGRQPRWMTVVDTCIAIIFLVELLVKLFLQRLSLFTGPDKMWNVMDAFLVVSGLMDAFLSFLNISFMRTFRVLRAFRALRLIKSLRFVRDLRLMLASIVCSASCLFWALVMLAVVLYLFSVFIMQGVIYFVEHRQRDPSTVLLQHYGTLADTMLSLFMAISGGMDWGDLIQPLLQISHWYYVVYIFFLLFVLFGIMNILTAIFCESANQIAEIDRDLVIQENIANDQSTINELRRVFSEFDDDESNTLNEQEFDLLLQDHRTTQHLATLGLDLQEAHGLFRLLDLTGSGEVAIDEFVNTLLRLKGSAKALDLATLIYENKKIMAQMTLFMKFVQSQFDAQNLHFGIFADSGVLSKNPALL